MHVVSRHETDEGVHYAVAGLGSRYRRIVQAFDRGGTESFAETPTCSPSTQGGCGPGNTQYAIHEIQMPAPAITMNASNQKFGLASRVLARDLKPRASAMATSRLITNPELLNG